MNQAVIASPTIVSLAAAALKFVGRAWSEDTRVGRGTAVNDEAAALKKNQILWMTNVFGREIRCEIGTLWLTVDGQPQDIILDAGKSHRCVSRSRLGVQALSDAKFRVAG